MSKSGRLKMMKKMIEKVDHSSKLRTNIPAGKATPSPPLGPQLGQRNINIAAFCKEFNERTADMKEGIPLPCRVKANADRTFDLTIHQPPATYFLKQAAGIEKGAMGVDEVAGKLTLKHIYEIAVIKSQDPPLALLNLKQVCQLLIGVAKTCGIQVVDKLDKEEYAQFLKDRYQLVDERKTALKAAREAKMLRTG